MTEKILERLYSLGIPELKEVTELKTMNGDYINLTCLLPNGRISNILDNKKQYLAAEIVKKDSEFCYGVAADDQQIAVYEYSGGGKNAKLVIWTAL
ncbi:hypothetical protein [Enterococcus sp. LJL90]